MKEFTNRASNVTSFAGNVSFLFLAGYYAQLGGFWKPFSTSLYDLKFAKIQAGYERIFAKIQALYRRNKLISESKMEPGRNGLSCALCSVLATSEVRHNKFLSMSKTANLTFF